jgi:hypothetical protein
LIPRERSRTSLVAAAWHAHPMSALVASGSLPIP